MGAESARRLREFAAVFSFILGGSSLLLWYAVFVTASQQGWQVTLRMPFGEGPAELVLMQIVLALVLLGTVGFHELMERSGEPRSSIDDI